MLVILLLKCGPWYAVIAALLLCTSALRPYTHLLIWMVVMVICCNDVYAPCEPAQTPHLGNYVYLGLLWRHFDATSTVIVLDAPGCTQGCPSASFPVTT